MHAFQKMDDQVNHLRRQIEAAEEQLRNLKIELQEAEHQAEAARHLEQAWAGGLHEDWINETLAAMREGGLDGGHDMQPAYEQEQVTLSNGNGNGSNIKPAQPGRWPLAGEEYKRYGRQLIMPEIGLHGQLRLKNAKVLIVGAGGLGCPAATYLAGAGVGTLGLVDGDTVEVSNLHRQMAHSTARVGKHKVDSAIEYLQAYVDNLACVQIDGTNHPRQTQSTSTVQPLPFPSFTRVRHSSVQAV